LHFEAYLKLDKKKIINHNKANINIKHQTSTKGKVEVVIDADVSFRVKK